MGILGDDIVTDNLDDLFWPIQGNSLLRDIPFIEVDKDTLVRVELPEIKWKKAPKPPLGKVKVLDTEWDELEHVKEQYEIKCDEIRGVHREMERLTKIILKHGLDKELELP